MRLTQPQQEIFESPARFRCVAAGRRFGKSFLSIHEMASEARQPNRRVYYFAPTYRMAKGIIWDELKARLLAVNWVAKINESDLTITLKNSSKICLRSLDNPDNARGIFAHLVIFDEAAFADRRAWDAIRPTLSTTNGRALFITTPQGRNWIYDLYVKGQDPNEHQWDSFSYTTIQGGFVSQDEIEQARRDLDEKTFKAEYEASFETLGSLVAWAFKREHNVRRLDNPDLSTIYVGLDFNINPLCAGVMVKQGEDLYVIDELYLRDSNTTEFVDELSRRYPRSKIFVYPDPSGRARKTSANGQTDFTILANAGFVVKAPNSHDAVRDRINAMNSRICSAQGSRHFYVDPACKHTLESFEKHMYKEGSTIPDKESGHDHMFDAISYAVAYMFPVRRNIDSDATRPQRWGHF